MEVSRNRPRTKGQSARGRRTGQLRAVSARPSHWSSGLTLLSFSVPSNCKTIQAVKAVADGLSYHPEGMNGLSECVDLTPEQALYQMLSKAKSLARDRDVRILKGKKLEFALSESREGDFFAHYVLELRYIWEIKMSHPKLFKVLMSLMHYLVKDCGVPIFSQAYLDYCQPDFDDNWEDEDDANENRIHYEQSYSYYKFGEPRKAAQFIENIKPLSLQQIRQYKVKDKALNDLIFNLCLAVESKVNIQNFINTNIQYDSGLYLDQVLYLSWDLDSVVEQEYCQFIDDVANNVGIIPPSEVLKVSQAGWAPGVGYSNLHCLADCFLEGCQIIRKLGKHRN